MREEPVLPTSEAAYSVDRLFRGLVQCLQCSARRLVDIRPSDFLVLRREGTITVSCPQCGARAMHRLVRIGS